MKHGRIQRRVYRIRQFFLLFSFYFSLFTLVGCEAFVRKFTRKPKTENIAQEEMVLVPEEYKGPQMSKEELYRQYFLFWKSWQDEISNALSQKASHKRKISCAEEAVKNLDNLKALLNEEKQKKLDTYIIQLRELKGLIAEDPYGNSAYIHIQNAERIRRNILRDFSYQKIKDYLL